MTTVNKTPHYVDFRVLRNNSTPITLEFQNPDGTPIDYTGYTSVSFATYWPIADTTVQLNVTETVVANGLIVGRIGNTEWASIPSDENVGKFAAKANQPDGELVYLATGRIFVGDSTL